MCEAVPFGAMRGAACCSSAAISPATYFLHPKTKHDPQTLRSILGRPGVELGLHPDALEAPERYDTLFREQAAWFKTLTGGAARSVRNHGFLNRGYWGHLAAWCE